MSTRKMPKMDSTSIVKLYEYSLRRSAEVNRTRRTQTCVACLTSDDSIASIFRMDVKLIGKLWECARVCVQEDTGYPCGLCSGCHKELIEAHAFQRRFRQSYPPLMRCQPTVALTTSNSFINNYNRTASPKTLVCISCMKCDDSIVAFAKMDKAIVHNIWECTEVVLQMNAAIPVGLCLNCRSTLINALSFRTRCQRSDSLVRKFLPVVALSMWTKTEPSIDANFNHVENPSMELISETVESDCPMEIDLVECDDDFFEDHAIKIENEDIDDNVFALNGAKAPILQSDIYRKPQKTKHTSNQKQKLQSSLKPFKRSNVLNKRKATIQKRIIQHSKDKSHKCNDCGKVLKDLNAFRKHKKLFCDSKTSCRICRKAFNSIQLLEEHKANPDNHKTLQCDNCSYATKKKCSLSLHMAKHIKSNPYKCDNCGKEYASRRSILKHLQLSCGKKASCFVCYKTFDSILLLKEHRATHLTFKCDKCSYSAIRKCQLRDHMANHSKKRPYKCDGCNKSYKSENVLRVHKRKWCSNKINLNCYLCQKLFDSVEQLEEHKAIPDVHPTFKCDSCSYSSGAKSQMRIHMITHSNVRTHICNYCGKSYKRLGTLQKHQKIQCSPSAHPILKCDSCSYSTAFKSQLRSHMITHSNSRSHKCNDCGNVYKRHVTLQIHQKTQCSASLHLIFECDNCSYSTNVKQKLRTHMRNHMKDERYKSGNRKKAYKRLLTWRSYRNALSCNICNKLFGSVESLEQHKATPDVHPTLKCDICSYSTIKKSLLIYHMKYH